MSDRILSAPGSSFEARIKSHQETLSVGKLKPEGTALTGNPFYRSSNALVGLFPQQRTNSFPPSPSPSASPSLAGHDEFGAPGKSEPSVWRQPNADRTFCAAIREFLRTYGGKPNRVEFIKEFKQATEASSNVLLRKLNVNQMSRRIKQYFNEFVPRVEDKKAGSSWATPMVLPIMKDASLACKAIDARFEYLRSNPITRDKPDASTEVIVSSAEAELREYYNDSDDSPPLKRQRTEHGAKSTSTFTAQSQLDHAVMERELNRRLGEMEQRFTKKLDKMVDWVESNINSRCVELEKRMSRFETRQEKVEQKLDTMITILQNVETITERNDASSFFN